MKHLFNAGIATALFFVFCAVVHLPYFFLTRLHVIEPCASMSMTISILGTMICIVEVIYFGYLLARANLDCSAKGAAWSILLVPAFSALERIGNIVAGSCSEGAFAEWWAAQSFWVGGISSFFSAVAVVALIWLGLSVRKSRFAMIMSFVVAYEAFLTLLLWSILSPTVAISRGVYTAVLLQYYIVWPLFYVSLAYHFRSYGVAQKC